MCLEMGKSDTNNDTESNKKPSKGPTIVIFVILGIILIGYTVYMFEAFKNQIFPFSPWEPEDFNMPDDAVLPLGDVSQKDTGADEEAVKERISDILSQNKDWYKSEVKNKPPGLTGKQELLEPPSD